MDNSIPSAGWNIVDAFYQPKRIFSPDNAHFFFASSTLVWWRNRRYQAEINDRSNAIKRQVLELAETKQSSADTVEFALFLRPFRADEQTLRPKMSKLTFFFGAFAFWTADRHWGNNLTPEGMLAQSIENVFGLPTISVAMPTNGSDSSQGVGRISLDEDWKRDVVRLMSASEFIFLIPSTNEGTLFEYRTIMADPSLICKTVLLIPPASQNARKQRLVSDALDLLFQIRDSDGSHYWEKWPEEWEKTAASGRSIMFTASGPFVSEKRHKSYENLMRRAYEVPLNVHLAQEEEDLARLDKAMSRVANLLTEGAEKNSS